jgi:hypothetical protein
MIKEDPTVKEEPRHSGYVGTPGVIIPPLEKIDYTWTQTKAPAEYQEDPIYLIEVGAEKYLYDDIMACLKDMITFDEPVHVYRYDPTHQRYSRYVVIEQSEESK